MAMAAFNTMTAIKKKMHTMKTNKETVFDRVDQLEQKLVEHKAVYEKVNSFLFFYWTRAVDPRGIGEF